MIEVVVTHPPDAERSSCVDCQHCKAAVSWWCTSKAARAEHRSMLPGRTDCAHWVPCRMFSTLTWLERVKLANGFSDYMLLSNGPKP